jgi:hypothetical protein
MVLCWQDADKQDKNVLFRDQCDDGHKDTESIHAYLSSNAKACTADRSLLIIS